MWGEMVEPLVFLPGLMCDARVFGPQIAEFSRDHTVITAPLRTGEAIESIARSVLTTLPPKFALAGHSMGGIVAMEILRTAPDRVSRLALLDTNSLSETPQSASAYEDLIVMARTGRLDEALAGVVKPEHLAASRRIDLLALLQKMGEGFGEGEFIRQLRALQRRRDYQSTLRRCKVPAAVICGSEDALTPIKRHRAMAELIPYANLTVIEGAGHLPTLEKPMETIQALREWLAQPFVLQ